ncbi:MAG: MHS family MFS transporter [Phenylobacterium sp.]|uniref:MFS transporter n=1 Tax=Phenylobacterium sp. TaxID=1871053 RepID=UPI001A6142DA|nr:MFS transporter [Phenylobacterium sp.]MBL8556002.1 MHS family MFS transporter [Phenylobacterium sp.]
MAENEKASNRRVLGASLVGTAVEFYDFYIYATAASLVFPHLFFPKSSESAQLLQSYATFAVAFFARPVGAAFFGHFGDRIGRKSTLVASLLTMGLSTLLIAFLPSYAVAGWIAPALLCLLRFGQGFGLGGEWGGAALLAVENAPPGWRARFGMFPQLGAPVGFIAANGLFLLLGLGLGADDFREWGWRLPFLASAILVGLGLWVRLRIGETPAFEKAMAESEASHVPMAEVVKRHFGALLGGTFAVVACFALFYISTAFALGHGTGKLGYGRETFLAVQLGAILFLAAGIVAAGYWADAANPRRVLMAGCGATVLVGLAMGAMMGAGSLALIWLWLSLALFTMGFVYGPLGAFLPSLFPPRVRYTGASMAFNLGGIVGGGLAPIAAQALADKGGLTVVGYYLVAAGVLSLAGLFTAKERYVET